MKKYFGIKEAFNLIIVFRNHEAVLLFHFLLLISYY